jgi:hypothetical protein
MTLEEAITQMGVAFNADWARVTFFNDQSGMIENSDEECLLLFLKFSEFINEVEKRLEKVSNTDKR